MSLRMNIKLFKFFIKSVTSSPEDPLLSYYNGPTQRWGLLWINFRQYIPLASSNFMDKRREIPVGAHSYAVDNIGLTHRLSVVSDDDKLRVFFSQTF